MKRRDFEHNRFSGGIVLLYHWTPAVNEQSILTEGIQRFRARSKRPVVWLVDRDHVYQLRDHIAAHNGCEPHELILFRVIVDLESIYHQATPGVYCSRYSIPRALLQRVRRVCRPRHKE
jgi:hypothetical protein